ncbi:MAG: PEP/pyruvate-binding domain-containing protein [Armatimonadota bacterium]
MPVRQTPHTAISGINAVMKATAKCWRSVKPSRAEAYRAARKTDESAVGMAVIVQHMVRSQASGVMFTCDPNDPAKDHLLIEGAWGLGEGVVSDRVQLDRFALTAQPPRFPARSRLIRPR